MWGWHGRSGMEGAVWKVLEGMVDMDGMEEWMEFRAKIQLFSDTAKFGGVIKNSLN